VRGRMIHRHGCWHEQSRQACRANALSSRTVDCAEHHSTSDNRRQARPLCACSSSQAWATISHQSWFWAKPFRGRFRRPVSFALGLDPAARPGRNRPPLGAEAPAAAHPRRRRSPHPQRPAPAAPARRTLALDPRHHPKPSACRPSRPADQPEPARRRERRKTLGPWNSAHPARQPVRTPRPTAEN
jgi:hypothetical protein